jgi:hypothetical protein
MSLLLRTCVAAALAAPCASANAESLRCSGGGVAEGDSRIAVTFKCGEPILRDSYCSPVYYGGTLQVVPEAVAGAFVPCQQVDEWVYDRGPGNLVATVRFRGGRVQSISYGRTPR